MSNTKAFLETVLLFLLMPMKSISAEQIHTFFIERDGLKFECRNCLPKDTFMIMEQVRGEFWMKYISRETVKFQLGKPYWWTILDETGKINRYPDFTIAPLKPYELKPGDSIGGITTLHRGNVREDFTLIDSFYRNPYFPLGKYKGIFGPDTVPFIFVVTMNKNSKKHLQIKAFYDFLEHDFRGMAKVDTALGIAFSLEGTVLQIPTSTDPVERLYEFLETNKKMIGLENPRSELKTNRHGDGDIELQQVYKGVRVSGGGLRGHITPAGKIYLDGSFHSEINISSKPKIDSIAAIERVLHDLKLPKDYVSKRLEFFHKPGNPTASLTILARNNRYHLVWTVAVFVDRLFDGWQYLIDAKTGGILDKGSTAIRN